VKYSDDGEVVGLVVSPEALVSEVVVALVVSCVVATVVACEVATVVACEVALVIMLVFKTIVVSLDCKADDVTFDVVCKPHAMVKLKAKTTMIIVVKMRFAFTESSPNFLSNPFNQQIINC
jgi:hypothetical protein